ncbi:MAG TPA: hypothetical protein VL688_05770 [Verrucomicrobiae bacterium]|jgi:hypothetical protein|nr:hypothetical protein [Verrucomicrobiae bacterium]
MKTSKPIWFRYKFMLPAGKTQEFHLELDPETLALIPQPRTDYPDWTRLSHFQCAHCPLKEADSPRCPIAANLVDVIEFFKSAVSYEEIDLEVESPSRTYKARTALQYALSSLIGLYMVTSGCPVMDKLRPLAAFHLPLASTAESTFRSLSMYLLAQWFLQRKGETPDWSLKDLEKIYADIQTLNEWFLKRVQAVHIQDAGLNAVFHLDCHAQYTNLFLTAEGLDNIVRFFHPYLNP